MLILTAATILAVVMSVSIIFLADLLLPDFIARTDNYALGFGIPLGVAPLLLYPMVLLNYRAERAKEELERMVRTDALTGIANRRAFFEHAERIFSANGPAAVMMIDIDHFKQINDRFGHAAGDQVIRKVARAICETVAARHCGGESWVARLGGEEFAVLIAGACAETSETLASEVCAAVRSLSIPVSGVCCTPTVSIGVAVRDAMQSLDKLMIAADRAAYAAKRKGRDTSIMVPPEAGNSQLPPDLEDAA